MESEFIKRQKEDFFRDITSFGSLWWFLIIILLFFLSKNYDFSKKLILGFVLIYAVCVVIRSFYFKNRPKKYSYSSYLEKIDASSFPSLHSSRAVFLSLALMEFFNDFLVAFFLVVLVLIICVSRIYLKKHDWKDVAAGMVVGTAVYLSIPVFL